MKNEQPRERNRKLENELKKLGKDSDEILDENVELIKENNNLNEKWEESETGKRTWRGDETTRNRSLKG